MKRYLMIFEGRVQGVGFRYTTYDLARSLSLTGHVRNLMNGNVEVEIQGSEESFNLFLKGVLKGNGFIRVTDYSTKEIPVVEDEKSYKIIG
ncbi:acylphosphatase [Proteiniclasticum sp.]|uniref:acylphosphatase n=1 Tax=Proteiniclasticum sp. TaxID=2053595 RepID=UPI002897CFB6|nr:acylphosphatase [Proteiniclasticum sp.]